MLAQVVEGSNISQVYLVYMIDISQPSFLLLCSVAGSPGRVPNSLEFEGIEGGVVHVSIRAIRYKSSA